MGALVLDPSIYEDIEADRMAALQSFAVVALTAAGCGVATLGIGLTGVAGVVAGAVIIIGGWLVWIMAVSVIGTVVLREPQTHSSASELMRTLGFATAPGVFAAFAAMRAAAPVILVVVFAWMIAATVVAMRQALDYRSTARAVVVSLVGWLFAAGVLAAIGMMFSRTLS